MAGFQDIIGQEQIKEHLRNALATGKVSHAYIINGEKSSGKEFIAKVFAMALQCEQGQMDPCQECRSCKQALSGNHPDIIYVTHEKPNTISVDDIRRQVNGDVAIKPYSAPRKVYLIGGGEDDGAGAKCVAENVGRAAGVCGYHFAYFQCEYVASHYNEPVRDAAHEAGGG